MKLAFVVSMPEDALESPLRRKQLARKIATIARLGYDGVELMVEDPRRVDVEKLRRLVEQYGLEVPAIGTGFTYLRYGLSLSDRDRRVRMAAVKRIEEYATLASALNSLVIVGLVRGRIERDTSPKRAWRRVTNCLKKCAKAAENLKVTLALEPINRYETGIVNTIEDALRMMNEVGSERVGVMADTFHMNIEEASVTEALRRAGNRLVHFHVADSNRLAPGMGHINFREVLNVLDEIEYSGYLSVEVLLKPNFKTAAQTSIEYLRKCYER